MREDRILLAHGSGGRLSHKLIEEEILPLFRNPLLEKMDDAAVFELGGRLAFTTDSYVVTPIFFPGGDIGKLAICGTVNDLAMVGAQPLYLSLSFIIEEGLPMEEFERVLRSSKAAAAEAGVQIVTGDVKVVASGGADKLFVNTAGIGVIPDGVEISGSGARPGDLVLINGTIGDHGIAVLSKREGLDFSIEVESDCAPLNHLVFEMLKASRKVHCLRDPTRGGLATALNEIARRSGVEIRIFEEKIPIREEVLAACEMLGFDPLYVANEGKLVAVVAPEDAELLLEVMRRNPYGREAAIIGEVREGHPGRVVMKTRFGPSRIIEMLWGDLLPRIC